MKTLTLKLEPQSGRNLQPRQRNGITQVIRLLGVEPGKAKRQDAVESDSCKDTTLCARVPRGLSLMSEVACGVMDFRVVAPSDESSRRSAVSRKLKCGSVKQNGARRSVSAVGLSLGSLRTKSAY
ncbi:hypothetical protein MRB53_041794 [Persea americana]|nr:hypothetical protein MRB53_041794 [Persea americana]